MNKKRKTEENEQMNSDETVIEKKDEIIPEEIPDQQETIKQEPQDKDLQVQIDELNDKYLRLYSEFDNYRKRTIKEKIELSKYAASDTIEKLLPVLDDFERAIKAFDSTNQAGQALKDGVVLIFTKFLTILNQQGLEQMRTIGESFDTDFHEAITNIPAPEPDQKGKIIDEVEKGYLLNGKVIRYAKVVVGN
ncbi:MAG: nucleotide exchange factor GrpE [Bacteroidales bacterium]|jgi:molecular chaperone GrpE|nr:nucleotide exchange factor GrpE [Bacteroidales bacterium]